MVAMGPCVQVDILVPKLSTQIHEYALNISIRLNTENVPNLVVLTIWPFLHWSSRTVKFHGKEATSSIDIYLNEKKQHHHNLKSDNSTKKKQHWYVFVL